jgi:hypothetical protein
MRPWVPFPAQKRREEKRRREKDRGIETKKVKGFGQ